MRKHHTSRRSERTDVRSSSFPEARQGARRLFTRVAVGLVAAAALVTGPVAGPLRGLTGPASASAAPLPAKVVLRRAEGPGGVHHRRSRAQRAVVFAAHQLGKPYQWGGTGPRAYDCSGLTQASWRAAGVGLARVAAFQYYSGRHVRLAFARPGDLVFWSSNGRIGGIYHVGLYIGHGLMIDAPHTGARVRIDHVWGGVFPVATVP